jgi:hypothetical protein
MNATVCEARLSNATDAVNQAQALQTVGWISAGAGAAVAITGLVLLATGDDPHRYDPKPVHPLLAGWSVLPEIGIRQWQLSAKGAF